MKTYKLGFDGWGALLFLLIMLPNLLWSVLPPSSNPLGGQSSTPLLDAAASVFQALTVAAVCCVKNTAGVKLSARRPGFYAAACCIVCYWAAWGVYYAGFWSPIVMLCLCIFPCLAFLLYAASVKNFLALPPAVLFSVLHLISGWANFALPS